MKWFYTLLAVCLGLLFFTNPDMNDFRGYVKEESQRMIREGVSAPGLGDALSDTGSQIAETFVENVTERKDYYLFSTYEIDLLPGNPSNKPFKFVGVGGTFINLRKFDARQK